MENDRPWIKRNAEGLFWLPGNEMWVTEAEYDAEMERRRKWREMMGSAEEVAALNNYEKGMGL